MRGRDFGDTAHYSVATAALGGVECLVGCLHQVRYPVHLFVGLRDANADGCRMCHFGQWTFGDFATQALRDDQGMVQIGFGQQHRKFFTTDPSEQVARSRAVTGKIGHVHDRAVADLMAETIIDHFEIVDVDTTACRRERPAARGEPAYRDPTRCYGGCRAHI